MHGIFVGHELLLHRAKLRCPDLHRRKHAAQKIDEVRRAKCRPVRCRGGERDNETRGLFCQIQIQIITLNVHLLPRRRRKLESRLLQKFAVQVGNEATLRCRARDASVVCPDEKQHLHLRKSGPLDITCEDAVRFLRQSTKLYLLQSGIHQFRVIRSGNRFIT